MANLIKVRCLIRSHTRYTNSCVASMRIKHLILIRLIDGEPCMRLINPKYFRRQSVENLTSVLFPRGPHFVGHIQEVMIKILNEITHLPYMPDVYFHLSDIEIYTAVTCHVSFQSEEI